MAKTNDNGGEEKPAFVPSALVMQALGDHAEEQGLVQEEGEEELAFAVRCIEVLGGIIIGMDESIQVLEADLKAANRRLSSQKGATTKAKAKIVELEEASKPRALWPMAAVFDDAAEAFTALDIMTAIDGAEEVVLAFSNGTSELKGVKPRQVSAEAFRLTRGRVFFTEGPLEVTGSGDPDTVTTLAGVALLIDGEQVAWSPMAQELKIGAGQTLNVAGSVVFG